MLGQEFHAARGAMRRPYAAPARVPKRSARRRGSALILVLGVLVLLSIIGTAFVMLMKIELRASVNFAEDVEAQFLARQALAYCLQHPLWNPPATGIPSEGVDNDNVGDVDSAFFTHPLAGLSGDTPARFAILKKPFGGRLNVNWNSFYIRDGAVDGHQALNEGSSTSEVSLEKAVAAYLNWIFDTYGDPFGAGDKTRSLDIAKEIAARIVNYRYGGQLPALPSPPLPYNPPYTVFHGSPSAGVNASGVTNLPGQGTPGLGFDDDVFLDDTTLDFEPPIGAAPVPIRGYD